MSQSQVNEILRRLLQENLCKNYRKTTYSLFVNDADFTARCNLDDIQYNMSLFTGFLRFKEIDRKQFHSFIGAAHESYFTFLIKCQKFPQKRRKSLSMSRAISNTVAFLVSLSSVSVTRPLKQS